MNTRRWSTPAIIGTGLFVSITGVMMFFGVRKPLTFAHEWIGVAFAAAILLHVLNHWKVFRSYFSQQRGLVIIGAAMAMAATLVVFSSSQSGGNFASRMIGRIEAAPLTEVAPLVDRDAQEVIASFEAAGIVVDSADRSVAEIAAANGTHPRALLEVLFD